MPCLYGSVFFRELGREATRRKRRNCRTPLDQTAAMRMCSPSLSPLFFFLSLATSFPWNLKNAPFLAHNNNFLNSPFVLMYLSLHLENRHDRVRSNIYIYIYIYIVRSRKTVPGMGPCNVFRGIEYS